ncbi:hypothetical protein TA3x_001531 [Tundrisphaera sp. TA3]|uniref:hypothetical protein n=1 Tax=Tundrisphaera sp. TA3 TaxID=3435775 RepID=UPI003EB7173C
MPLHLVGDDSGPPAENPLEALVLDDLIRAAGLASSARIAERLGVASAQVERVLKTLVRKGRARTCRWADGVFYEAIEKPAD